MIARNAYVIKRGIFFLGPRGGQWVASLDDAQLFTRAAAEALAQAGNAKGTDPPCLVVPWLEAKAHVPR